MRSFQLMIYSLILFAVSLTGCEDKIPEAAKKALLETKSIEFYSLSPEHMEATVEREGEEEANKRFHDWKILGKMTLDADETRDPLVTAFIRAVNENEGMVAGCFNPRHGLRLTHDGKVHDFVICFECMSVKWFVDSERQSGSILITESAVALFNKTLSDAEIPLPKN